MNLLLASDRYYGRLTRSMALGDSDPTVKVPHVELSDVNIRHVTNHVNLSLWVKCMSAQSLKFADFPTVTT